MYNSELLSNSTVEPSYPGSLKPIVCNYELLTKYVATYIYTVLCSV